MAETLMRLVTDFGALSLFLILAINCLGLPFPTSLIMLALGALAAQDEVSLVAFVGAGVAGAVVGDQLGYGLGRLGKKSIARRAAYKPWLSAALKRAVDFESAWGDAGIFLSRWLLSPLGPYVNIVAGMTGYSWPRFTFWGFAGEAVWVFIYMGLGAMFSHSVEMLADLMGNLTWMLVAAVVASLVGWKLYAMFHPNATRPGISP